MPPDTLTTKRVPLSALHLDPSNARAHGPHNLESMEGSLRRFGQAEPLVVQAGTGRVIGGNGRLVAMKALGWTECDIVELDVADLKATALGIALNRTAELAEWDEPVLFHLNPGSYPRKQCAFPKQSRAARFLPGTIRC